MDPFAIIVLGGVGGVLIALLLIGRLHPGSGVDVVDRKPTRSTQLEVGNELDDLDQMLAATNARRRARGKSDLTEAGLSAEIAEATALAYRRQADDVGDLDVARLLETGNARRLRKGLAPITLEDHRRQIEGAP